MAKYKYGFKEFWIRDIDPANGTGLAAGELNIKDEIFRDSFDMNEEDGTETEIYTEMENTPILVFQEPGKEALSFQLVNTRPERLQKFLGGTIVTTASKVTWSKPDNQGIIEKHVTILLLDDTEMVIPRAKLVGKKNFVFRRNQIWTLDINLTPLQPEFAGLAPMDISEPV